MAVNYYFNNFENSSEQSLIEDLIIESIRIYGHDVFYIKRTLDSLDDLMNEDDTSTFQEAYMAEMYIKNVDGFEGEGDFLSKFGLQIRDSITFTIAISVFNTEIAFQTSDARPMEGDLIYLPLNNKIFQIQHVEHEAIFYQMGQLQTYDIRCELFEYSGEKFSTGIANVDSMFENYDISLETAANTIENIDPIADNIVIETEGDNILDFSEENPFGENNF
tara:strand:+ start:3076 stop:3735 length:660 start_codon:yes stop_codon:yes gene_type:complete